MFFFTPLIAPPESLNCFPAWLPQGVQSAVWDLRGRGLDAGHVSHAMNALRYDASARVRPLLAPQQGAVLELLLDDNPEIGDGGAAAVASFLRDSSRCVLRKVSLQRCNIRNRSATWSR